MCIVCVRSIVLYSGVDEHEPDETQKTAAEVHRGLKAFRSRSQLMQSRNKPLNSSVQCKHWRNIGVGIGFDYKEEDNDLSILQETIEQCCASPDLWLWKLIDSAQALDGKITHMGTFIQDAKEYTHKRLEQYTACDMQELQDMFSCPEREFEYGHNGSHQIKNVPVATNVLYAQKSTKTFSRPDKNNLSVTSQQPKVSNATSILQGPCLLGMNGC